MAARTISAAAATLPPMPPKARQIRMDQRSAMAEMQALEQRSDEELEREQKYRSAALSILGARAAERYDAQAARAYFQKAIAAARPQERMQIRRMADASIALAERRPDDLKEAVERLGQEAPSSRQLLLLRVAGLLAPPPGAGTWLRVRGVLLIVALVVALLVAGWGVVKLVALPFGGVGNVGAVLLGLLVVAVALGVLTLVGRRRQARARAAARGRADRSRAAVCGRYSLAAPNPALLRERFALGDAVAARAALQHRAGPGRRRRDDRPRGRPARRTSLRWGLVPLWADGPEESAIKMINARAETLDRAPGVPRRARRRDRCLIVADGFYEWQPRTHAPKQPWWITRADGEPFAFAGLWAIWRPAAGRRAAAQLHDRHDARRTPALARDPRPHAGDPRRAPPRRRGSTTATPRRGPARAAARRSRTSRPTRMPVSTAVNDARHDAPDCIEPVEPRPDEPREPSLF